MATSDNTHTGPRHPAPNLLQQAMFWFQWFTPAIGLFFLVIGRAIFYGQTVAWGGLVFSVFGIPIAAVATMCCLLTLGPEANRATKSLPLPSAVLGLIALVVFPIAAAFVEDFGDSENPGTRSAVGRWFEIGYSTTSAISTTLLWLGLIAFFASIALSFLPRRPRRRASADS
ncbi:hypothetical protein [Gulosibacter sp. 10]|uniref:hypothetical protein n=1 Tax=Gulosibacter sp. 10 TaxID=1255570 RepID=UPI00097EEC2F|nr:hypothetical protein [Gulosibacter sp. 10]SJM60557.1 hypothetical protein FM112_07245 [Gulosibacter sp. 10]